MDLITLLTGWLAALLGVGGAEGQSACEEDCGEKRPGFDPLG
jgi:hypothetical protein